MMSDTYNARPGISMAYVSGKIEGGVNGRCHTYISGVKANQKRILGNPRVVLIFWGHNYVTNSNDVTAGVQLISDLVTGPFMNGLVQYGVDRGSVAGKFVIDTNRNKPAPAMLDEMQAQAQIISWLNAGTVKPAPSIDETNLLYFLFPPPTTQLTLTDGTTGFCGYHLHGKFNSDSHHDDLFWAIVSTSGATPGTGTMFANSFAYCVSHELDEAFSDRDNQGFIAENGCEIGDICETKTFFPYRGWMVEQYWSNWDSSCIQGDQPVSLRKYLRSIGFDASHGLRSLHTPVINLEYMALKERVAP
jgi:hypothetical protein